MALLNDGEAIKQLGFSYNAGGHTKLYSHFENTLKDFCKLNVYLP